MPIKKKAELINKHPPFDMDLRNHKRLKFMDYFYAAIDSRNIYVANQIRVVGD